MKSQSERKNRYFGLWSEPKTNILEWLDVRVKINTLLHYSVYGLWSGHSRHYHDNKITIANMICLSKYSRTHVLSAAQMAVHLKVSRPSSHMSDNQAAEGHTIGNGGGSTFNVYASKSQHTEMIKSELSIEHGHKMTIWEYYSNRYFRSLII